MAYNKNRIKDEFNFEVPYEGVPENGYGNYMKYLLSKIINITSRIKIGIPSEFYTNMMVSMHLSDRIEKYMLIFQGNHDYLVDNSNSMILPLSSILFGIEELKMYDPFTILNILSSVYYCTMERQLKEIAIKNSMDPSIFSTRVKYNYQNVNNVAHFHGYFRMESKLYDYAQKLIYDYNNNLLD